MIKRRDLLKLGLAAGGARVLTPHKARAQDADLSKYLCSPDSFPDQLAKPSPNAQPRMAALFVPPVIRPVDQLDPPPDPRSHQRCDDFPSQRFDEIHEREFLWQYHPHPLYDKGNWPWEFLAKKMGNLQQPMPPGPTYRARYGEPILVRRVNDQPPVGISKVGFALPSTTSHLHHGHTTSETQE
jgi:hypothetical protein